MQRRVRMMNQVVKNIDHDYYRAYYTGESIHAFM